MNVPMDFIRWGPYGLDKQMMRIEKLEMIGRITTTGLDIEVFSSLQKFVKLS